MQKQWHPSLDFLRIASALLVVFSHYRIIPPDFFWGGVHGVCIFFMVSGYCMGFSVEGRTLEQFAFARFSRLLPAFFVAVLLTAGIEVAFSSARGQPTNSALLNMICIPTGNLLCDAGMLLKKGVPVGYDLVDGVYWSLLVEFRFYALLALLFFILRLSQRNIVYTLSALGVLSVFQPFANVIFSKASDFLMYLPFFAFGIAYRLGRKLLLIAPLSAFVVIAWFGSKSLSMSINAGNAFSFALCFAAFFLAMSVRFKYSEWLKTAGTISYPLYLLHQDLGYVISQNVDMYPMLLAWVKFAVMLVLAWGAHRFIEKPARKLSVKVSARLKSA